MEGDSFALREQDRRWDVRDDILGPASAHQNGPEATRPASLAAAARAPGTGAAQAFWPTAARRSEPPSRGGADAAAAPRTRSGPRDRGRGGGWAVRGAAAAQTPGACAADGARAAFRARDWRWAGGGRRGREMRGRESTRAGAGGCAAGSSSAGGEWRGGSACWAADREERHGHARRARVCRRSALHARCAAGKIPRGRTLPTGGAKI